LPGSVLAIWRRRVRLCFIGGSGPDEARARAGELDGEPDMPLASQQAMFCRFPAKHAA